MMNWADWLILATIGLSSLISLMRGFVKEALSLVVWFVAFLVASRFHAQAAVLLEAYVELPSLRYALAFGGLFVATIFLGSLVNFLIGHLVTISGLSGTDRVLGMAFGALRGALIVLALVLLVPRFVPIDQDPWWKESQLIPHFLVLEDWAREVFADLWQLKERLPS